VLLFLILAVFCSLLQEAYFPFKAEDAVNITHVEYAGTSWRVMEVAVFNWIGLPLFGQWWQGLVLLSGMISVGLAFAAYLFWLELAYLLRDRARAALGGGVAPGLLAAYLLLLLGDKFHADVTGVSYRLAGLFALLTLAASLRFLRTGQSRWWACAMATYLLAAFSHSFSWPLGLLVLLLELTRRRREPHGPLRNLALRYLLLALAPALVLALTGRQLLAHFLPGFVPMHVAESTPATLLLGRYLYAVFASVLVGNNAASVPTSAGGMEWAVEVLLAAAAAVGIWRLVRGRGLDLYGLAVLLVLVWFSLTMPSFWGANIEWVAGRHRFQYTALGPILVAGYVGARLLALATTLAPSAWRGPRLIPLAALAVIGLHLPFSPAAVGVWRAVSAGRLGLDHPCPALARCGDVKEPGDGELEPLLRAGTLRCVDLNMRALPGQRLAGADLRRCNLSGAKLTGAALDRARLTHSCGYFADLRQSSLKRADLSGARLMGAFLNRADLTGANLRGAGLRAAHFQDATLQDADLRGADLVRATLSGADLRGADLTGANLTASDLRSADLRGAKLRGAILLHADVAATRPGEADLQDAILCRSALNDFNNRGGFKGTPKPTPCGDRPPPRHLRPPWY